MLRRVFFFYRDGFRAMTLGCTLWKLILIKLLIDYKTGRKVDDEASA